jgi:copper(I)-binding protein
MRQIILEIAAATMLTVGAILSLAAQALASDVMVMKPYARASATPAAKAGAVYMTIVNHGAGADRLIAVAADVSKTAHLHESVDEGGVASMRAVDALDIGPHGEVQLAPGGLHVMLLDLKQPLKQGAHFNLTLTFEKAGPVVVDVPVGGVAEGADAHQDHDAAGSN